VSYRSNQGYGRTLLNFLIQKAKQHEYKEVLGICHLMIQIILPGLFHFINPSGLPVSFSTIKIYMDGIINLDLHKVDLTSY
jgi:hypothetical protein